MSNNYRQRDPWDDMATGMGQAMVLVIIYGIAGIIGWLIKEKYYSREVKFEAQGVGTVIGQSNQVYYAEKRPKQIGSDLKLKPLQN